MSRKPSVAENTKPRIDGDLSPSEVFNIICKECDAEIAYQKGKNDDHTTVFTPYGWESFCAVTNYGKVTPENELELQFIPVGYYFKDKAGRTTTVITNIIAPPSVSQGKVSAELYSEDGSNTYEYIKRKEAELVKYSTPGKNLESGVTLNPFVKKFGPPHRDGLGHIHPEDVGCFFSSVDRSSVFAAPGEPWITMVACPRRRDIIAGVGPDLKPSRIIAFDNAKDEAPAPKAEIVTTHIKDITLDQLLNVFHEAYKAEIPVSFSISGRFPGKVKFKGTFSIPKKKR